MGMHMHIHLRMHIYIHAHVCMPPVRMHTHENAHSHAHPHADAPAWCPRGPCATAPLLRRVGPCHTQSGGQHVHKGRGLEGRAGQGARTRFEYTCPPLSRSFIGGFAQERSCQLLSAHS